MGKTFLCYMCIGIKSQEALFDLMTMFQCVACLGESTTRVDDLLKKCIYMPKDKTMRLDIGCVKVDNISSDLS